MAFDRNTNKIYKNEQECSERNFKKGKSKTRRYTQNVPDVSYSLLQHLEESKECHLSGKDKQKTEKQYQVVQELQTEGEERWRKEKKVT